MKGSLKKSGAWESLWEGELIDTTGGPGGPSAIPICKPASLLSFTFEKPVEIQFLKFELISYWGIWGGGLQYFAAIPATSK